MGKVESCFRLEFEETNCTVKTCYEIENNKKCG